MGTQTRKNSIKFIFCDFFKFLSKNKTPKKIKKKSFFKIFFDSKWPREYSNDEQQIRFTVFSPQFHEEKIVPEQHPMSTFFKISKPISWIWRILAKIAY